MSLKIWDGSALRTIGGAAQTADLHLIAGQSNARGRGLVSALPTQLTGPIPNAFIWNGAAFVQLEAGVTNQASPGTQFGPEMMLGYLAARAAGKPVYIVKLAQDSTSLTATTGDSWDPARADSLYAALVSRIDAARAALTAQGKTPVIKSLTWVQGEQDATLSNIGPLYQTKQTVLFRAIRALAGNPSLPILDVLVRSEAAFVSTAAVNTAKQNVAVAVGNVRVLSSEFMEDTGDNTHYDSAAQLALGRYAYNQSAARVFRLPLGLPPRAAEYNPNRPDGLTSSSLLRIAQLTDLSGNGRHMTYADASRLPSVREGSFGLGQTAMEYFFYPSNLSTPASGLAADAPYTVYYLISRMDNYNIGTGARPMVLSSGVTNWVLRYPPSSQGPQENLEVRHGNTTFMTSSVKTSLEPEVVVVAYGGAAGSYMRRNGVETAVSSQVVAYSAGNDLALGSQNASQMGFRGPTGVFNEKLSVANAQKLEASLMWEFGFESALPVSHPFKSAAPI